MAMGASFDIKKAFYKLKPSIACAFLKLIGYSGVLMPVAIALGYRNEALVAILVMLGSATTVSSYTMAKSMGHEGTLSASVVMLTTLLSAFSLTAWLFILKTARTARLSASLTCPRLPHAELRTTRCPQHPDRTFRRL